VRLDFLLHESPDLVPEQFVLLGVIGARLAAFGHPDILAKKFKLTNAASAGKQAHSDGFAGRDG